MKKSEVFSLFSWHDCNTEGCDHCDWVETVFLGEEVLPSATHSQKQGGREEKSVNLRMFFQHWRLCFPPRNARSFQLLGSKAEVKWQGWGERTTNNCNLHLHFKVSLLNLKEKKTLMMLWFLRASERYQGPQSVLIFTDRKNTVFSASWSESNSGRPT